MRGGLDVGFLYLPFTDDTLRYEIIHREPLVAMLPQHHDLASREHIPLRMLTCEPFVLPPYTRAYGGRDQIMRICQKAGFMPHVVQEATQAITIASLVAAGIGVSVVSMSSQTLRAEGVVYRAISEPTVMRELVTAWHGENHSAVLKVFLEVVREKQVQNG